MNRNSTAIRKGRPSVAVLLVILIALPLVVGFGEAFSHHLRNRTNGKIISSGEEREYLLYVPESYNGEKPAALVISMHGAGGWPVQQREISGWNRIADREGILVVYPSGVAKHGPRGWRVGASMAVHNDIEFIADLIDAISKDYNVDPQRIYANGLSNGAGMSFALSCEMPDRIAAVGLVASAMTVPWEWCPDPTPVPMIAFHGTADPVTPYAGGSSWIGPVRFPDIADWAERWARRNRCAAGPVESEPEPDINRRGWIDCTDDANVILYTIRNGGHTWPGGMELPEWFLGRTSDSIDATELMWRFFESHPLS